MKLLHTLGLMTTVSGFTPIGSLHRNLKCFEAQAERGEPSFGAPLETPKSAAPSATRREAFVSMSTALLASAALSTAPEPSFARGRSTQVAAWSRYGSRVEAMRSWLVGDLKAYINSGDYAGLKEATGKKGVAGSYISALDLWASSYSDASFSEKTVAMEACVAAIRTDVAQLNVLAKKALGEEVKKSGGLPFGFGAKEEAVPTGAAMATLLAEVAGKAKASYNEYCELNNVGHPFEVDELVLI